MLAGIVALSEDAIISIDADQRITLFNGSAERMFGYTSEEVLGQPLDILIPERFREKHREYFRRFLASPDPLRPMNSRDPIAWLRKDASEFPAEATISKFTSGGEVVCTVRLRDITGRLAAEEERASLLGSAQEARAAAENAAKLHRGVEERLTMLVEASGRLLGARSEDVFSGILDLASRLLKADAYAVWRVDPSVQQWRIASSAGLDGVDAKEAAYPASGSLDELKEALAIPDVAADPRLQGRAHLVSAGVRALLAVPLRMLTGPPGAITFYWRERYTFTPTDLRVASALANLSSSAIAAAELVEEQKRMRAQAENAERRAAFLAEATAMLGASLDYETTLRSVARLAVPAFADWCTVDIKSESGSVRRLAVAHSDPARISWAEEVEQRYPFRRRSESALPHVLETGQSELYPDIPNSVLSALAQDEEHSRLLREVGMKSAILMPMKARGHILGVLTFITAESGRRYGTEDLTVAEHLGRRAALAIDNAALYETAQRERADAQAALEALQHSNQELQNFAYVASHDLQEPLRVIASFTQLLVKRYKGKLGQEADEFIDFIVDGVQRMHNLIHDLLGYSRAMNTPLSGVHPVGVSESIGAAMENLRVAVAESGAKVECGPLPAVMAEETQLVQLFQNLIGNAIKYRSPDREPQIRIEARDRGPDWMFSVTDNGIGIEAEYRDRIFGIFKRLHGRSTPGTGVGLAICKKVVERYGGRIWVDSTPGSGSTFYFTIPK